MGLDETMVMTVGDEQQVASNDVDNQSQEEYNTSVETPSSDDVARKEGWVPKEEFRGDPNKWVDADTWVKRGEIMRPLKDEIAKLRREHERERAQMISAMNDIQRIAREDAEKKIQEIRGKQKAAFEAGDWNTFEAADAARRELENGTRNTAPAPDHQALAYEAQKAAEEFKAANTWFERDPVRTEAAQNFVALAITKAQSEGRVLMPEDFRGLLNEAGRRYAPQATPKTPVAPSTGNRPAPQQGKRFSDLSAEDKQTFDALYRRGIFKRAGSLEKAQENYAKEILSESIFQVRS